MDDKNSPVDGSVGEYPGTYGSSKTISYNGLSIALVGNDSSALNADHNRVPNETITPDASRGITGPFVQPYDQRTPTPQGDEKTTSGFMGSSNKA